MLNQMILVGRLTRDIVVEKSEDKNAPKENKKYAVISLAIPRSFKNSEGVYDTDFVDCYAFDSIAANSEIRLIAEKVTFLSSKKSEED